MCQGRYTTRDLLAHARLWTTLVYGSSARTLAVDLKHARDLVLPLPPAAYMQPTWELYQCCQAMTIEEFLAYVTECVDVLLLSAPAMVRLELADGREFRFPFPEDAIPSSRRVTDTARRHSDDFRSVLWDGANYEFTTNQARVVQRLWEAWENGTPSLSQDALLTSVDLNAGRLRDVFKGNDAWGKLIVPGDRRGSFKLRA